MNVSNSPAILFLSGASGAGKTSILLSLKQRITSSDYIFLHYDSMGVPSFKEMLEQAGSLEHWQEVTTYRWIERIGAGYADDKVVLIEGQSNLDFITGACQRYGIAKYAIILLDCDWQTMKDRLRRNRGQPELANDDMRNWADFLREQAQSRGIPIIKTADQAPEVIAEIIEKEYLIKLYPQLRNMHYEPRPA